MRIVDFLLYGYDDHVLVIFHNVGSVLPRSIGATAHRTAAVDPDHNRKKLPGLSCWCPNIQRQAILRYWKSLGNFIKKTLRTDHASATLILYATVTVCSCIELHRLHVRDALDFPAEKSQQVGVRVTCGCRG